MECTQYREPWNKGKLVGQKPPLKSKDIWAIRINLQNEGRIRDLAMFNLAIDSKLRGRDLVNLCGLLPLHGSKNGRRIYALFSFCSGTRSWKALSGISGSR